jgi:hypothetical protein
MLVHYTTGLHHTYTANRHDSATAIAPGYAHMQYPAPRAVEVVVNIIASRTGDTWYELMVT